MRSEIYYGKESKLEHTLRMLQYKSHGIKKRIKYNMHLRKELRNRISKVNLDSKEIMAINYLDFFEQNEWRKIEQDYINLNNEINGLNYIHDLNI